MKTYAYHTIVFGTSGLFGGRVKPDKFDQMLNNMGSQGWELVNTIPSSQYQGYTSKIVCVFKRAIYHGPNQYPGKRRF